MSYYSIVKIELLKDYFDRVRKSFAFNSPFTIDLPNPTVYKSYYACTYGDFMPKYILLWRINHSPEIDDFADWLVQDLKLPTTSFNIQIWGETDGYIDYIHNINNPNPPIDPNFTPQHYGELSPDWMLGHEFTTDLSKIHLISSQPPTYELCNTQLHAIYDNKEYTEYLAHKYGEHIIELLEALSQNNLR